MSGTKRFIWNVIVNGLLASAWFPERLRPRLMRLLGAEVGAVSIRRRVDFYGPNLKIGDRTFINVGTQVQNFAPVVIGSDVRIGPGVAILTVDHVIGPSVSRAMDLIAKPVFVGDGCWIAASATILPGVRIGQGCIIAAGAIVRADCSPDGLYGGVPARRLRDLPVP